MSQPPQQVAMATPMHSLPANQQGGNEASDPLVADVLNEMEKEVAKASMPPAYATKPAPQQPQQFQQNGNGNAMAMPQLPYHSMSTAPANRGWWDIDMAKKVLVAMVLSYVLFQPALIFPYLYNRFETIHRFRSYDTILRALLFGSILYAVFVYAKL